MSERKVLDGKNISIKDENGQYVPSRPAPLQPATPKQIENDISIDDLLNLGLDAIRGTMRAIRADVGTGMPTRETVQNLRDIMGMLNDLKKKEQELLDNLSDEQLEALLKK